MYFGEKLNIWFQANVPDVPLYMLYGHFGTDELEIHIIAKIQHWMYCVTLLFVQ